MNSAHNLGAYLRRHRERSGLSVEAVSSGSRIVPRLVDALEADRQDLLPAPVYVRGFICAYCAQVGADAEEALRLYDERVGPPPPLIVRTPIPPRPSSELRAGGVAWRWHSSWSCSELARPSFSGAGSPMPAHATGRAW